MTPQEVIENLNWRYACKKFNPNAKIPTDIWNALEEALLLSASSLGLQLWHYIVVDTPSLREELCKQSWNQQQVCQADRYIVFCVRKDATTDDVQKHLNNMAKVRHTDLDALSHSQEFLTSYIQNLSEEKKAIWLPCQIHIALGFLLSTAAMLKVDTCTIGGMNPSAYDAILNLENSPYRAVLGVALGYRADDDAYAQQNKVRFPKSSVIEHL